MAEQEKKKMEEEKIQILEMESHRHMEREITDLENKVKAQEDSLRKKNHREDELLKKIQMYEANMELKQQQIDAMNSKMVYYETFKHKFV